MPLVTDMGCSASAVTGAYAACAEPLIAAAAAMAVFASAGEKAGSRASGPGTFLPAFLDELYTLDAEDAARRCGFRQIHWVRANAVITTHGGPAAFGVAGLRKA